MIKINENLKNHSLVDYKTFPHLFAYDMEQDEYYQISEFWWEFDEDYNLIIETTISSKEKLQQKILETLEKQKRFGNIIIDREQQKISAIDDMLYDIKGE